MTTETLAEVVVSSDAHVARLNTDLQAWRENLASAPEKMMEAASKKNIAEFTKWSGILQHAEGEIKSLEAQIRKATGAPVNNAAAEASIKAFETGLAEFLTGDSTVALVRDAKTVAVRIVFAERKRGEKKGDKLTVTRLATPRIDRHGGYGTKETLQATGKIQRISGRYSRGSLKNEILTASKLLERFANKYQFPEEYKTANFGNKNEWIGKIVSGEQLVKVNKDGKPVD